jgi:hypothetical protein
MKSPSDFGASLATLNDLLSQSALLLRSAQAIAGLLLEHAADDLEKPRGRTKKALLLPPAEGEQRYDTLGRRIPATRRAGAGRPPTYATTPGVCPKCHKQFKNLKLHVRLKHTHAGRMAMRERLSHARSARKLAA